MEIPYQKLDPEVLRKVITEYVTRESTDYCYKEFSLADKIAMIQSQLESGRIRIVFNPQDETCNIVSKS